ncbi:sigma-70 family RNA polymerase sigma factor [Roseiconus nitratireducens]|uniref:Sigma-70 family RNA polymerase sigma factor n=1 Tax=Roseiconus nitratireducens TaxID=2605748 RepID=A0A5M6CR53_9BACT|nr:sigma-70 family RNA polymerase sigma factor [Roseiconus nitratireducens]KAA5535659.1 sigma-70 family RNA polymerase sigma factor [Roseiconus nitratireducens]
MRGGSMAGWDTDELWEDLRTEFVDATCRSNSWPTVWHVFIDNEFYRSQLWTCAERSLIESGAPTTWCDDVAHDAMLLLARQLQKRTDLGYDFDRPPHEFASWLRTILFRQCKEAIRSLRRRHGRDLTLEIDPVGGRTLMIEQQIDVRMAIDNLDEPVRTIMFLSYGGLSIREIADRIELTYDQVRYARTQGRAMLAERLQTGYRFD